MRTVYHPTHPGVSYSVQDAAVQSWKDQGWRLSPPPENAKATTQTTASTAGETTTEKESD